MTRLSKALPLILPLAARWAEQQEKRILLAGVALREPHLSDAALMGVQHPEKIRLLKVDEIRIPDSEFLRWAASLTGLISPETVGLTVRYGIFIRADYWKNRRLIAHECVHTAQYERFGGFKEFLGRYLHECLEIGYSVAPLEREAMLRSEQIAG
jgi:hypothetical protein